MNAKQLRNSEQKYNKKIKKEPCFVCNKHEKITQLHHIIPLKNVAEKAKKEDRDAELLECENDVIWLCPNCHAYTHLMYQDDFDFDSFARYLDRCGDYELIDNFGKLIDLKFDVCQRMESV